MTLVDTAIPQPTDRRARAEDVQNKHRGRERRRAAGRVNRIAPRKSRLQVMGALCTTICLAGVVLMFTGANILDMSLPWGGVQALAGLLALSVLSLIMGSIEQRLIEIRLELMMLNGGRRRADGRSER